jgi:hypothetical protein
VIEQVPRSVKTTNPKCSRICARYRSTERPTHSLDTSSAGASAAAERSFRAWLARGRMTPLVSCVAIILQTQGACSWVGQQTRGRKCGSAHRPPASAVLVWTSACAAGRLTRCCCSAIGMRQSLGCRRFAAVRRSCKLPRRRPSSRCLQSAGRPVNVSTVEAGARRAGHRSPFHANVRSTASASWP